MERPMTYRRTRIAPTPSGFLHLGNVVSFVRAVELGKRMGGKVLLRIDDMDRERVEKKYVRDIFDTLEFLELPWDEGPRNVEEFERDWSQVHRMGLYREALEVLREGKDLFGCNCSRAQVLRDSVDGVYPGTCREKEISLEAGNVSWRLRTDDNELGVRFLGGGAVGDDVIGEGRVVKARMPGSMKDFVVRKRDGFPAYQLTSVVDDLYYGVDLVVRGEDLWDSTVAQHFLAGKLGKGREFGAIGFYHHPLLMAEGERKLSKSAGDTSVQYLRTQGLNKKDVYTMIARMMGREEAPGSWEDLAGLANDL
ncbi:MAG TPA: glutamate--tRNA ligase family protein [Puia sp.]|nr:glutamate--tRNA ligase family protein [Puia sp.]